MFSKCWVIAGKETLLRYSPIVHLRRAGLHFKMITSAGKSWDVQAEPGDNLMKVGIKAGVPYEVACGGNAECCTCHVYLPKSVIEAEDYVKPDD